MKRLVLYTLVGLLVYALALAWLIPSERWFGLWQSHAPQWTAGALTGNIFAGSVQQLQTSQHRVGELHWRWRPSALLSGKLGFHLRFSDGEAQLEGDIFFGLIAPARSPIRFLHLQGKLPLTHITGWLNLPPQTFAALLQADGLEFIIDPAQERLLAADGLLIIEQVQLIGSNSLDLGTFELQLNTVAGHIQGLVEDIDSPLELQTRLLVEAAENYRIDYQLQGELAARPQADQAIRSLLSLLGTATADGKQHFSFQGRI